MIPYDDRSAVLVQCPQPAFQRKIVILFSEKSGQSIIQIVIRNFNDIMTLGQCLPYQGFG